MTGLKAYGCRDYTTACLKLNELIAARYPGNPDAMDDLSVKAFTSKAAGAGRQMRVLAAWPTTKGARADNLLMTYFEEQSARAE